MQWYKTLKAHDDKLRCVCSKSLGFLRAVQYASALLKGKKWLTS